ncbi:NUDIX hydrolase [Actinomycetospora rhizophila]|uniref:NUDIX hydrolase n=1 Tax=Actinomycetospora rhizophila TaxID=1416876 RepID=A0ABV9Z8I8_9PSEU
MADTPKHSVSVAGIVVDDQDRVLVIQRRDNNRWEPPGGVLELDETPDEGARREVLEETGVRVVVERLTGVYKNMSKGIVALVFLCRPEIGIPVTTDESRDARWITLNEVDLSMSPAFSVRVRDAFSDEVSVRSHDGHDLLGALYG